MSTSPDTALAVRKPETTEAITAYGNRYDLDALANRFLAFYSNDVGTEAAAATNAALKAAQYTIRFGMTPGVHIHIVKRGGKWGAELTYEAWKAFADRHSFMGGYRYYLQTNPMTPEQVKLHTSGDIVYDPRDRGYFARVFRFDIARECKEFGIPYEPEWQLGFWRQNAYPKKDWIEGTNGRKGYYRNIPGEFEPDTIPNQRTPEWVAEKRASRAALSMAFTMIELDDFQKRYESIERVSQARAQLALAHIGAEISERQRKVDDLDSPSAGLFLEKQDGYIDENGDYWAGSPPPTMQQAPAIAAGLAENPDGWGDWATSAEYGAAKQWALETGKFGGAAHVDKAWDKHVGFLAGMTASEVLAKWRDYVNNHKETRKGGAKGNETVTKEHSPIQGDSSANTTVPAPPAAAEDTAEEWQGWKNYPDMINWGVSAGHYANTDKAREMFAQFISARTGGYSKKNAAEVHQAWHDFHLPIMDDDAEEDAPFDDEGLMDDDGSGFEDYDEELVYDENGQLIPA